MNLKNLLFEVQTKLVCCPCVMDYAVGYSNHLVE